MTNFGILPEQESGASRVVLRQDSESTVVGYRDRIDAVTRRVRRLGEINPAIDLNRGRLERVQLITSYL